MNILSILPLTDSFSRSNAGAASLFIKEVDENNKKTYVVGSTINKDTIFDKRYFNINKINKIPFGSNIDYANKIIKIIKKYNFKIIEIHNRPQIALHIKKKLPNIKTILYFHNDPNKLRLSETTLEKNQILKSCDAIIFLSQWIRNKFFNNIGYKNTKKAHVVYPGVKVQKKMFPKKEKIIMFSGKLNSSKGYDIFCYVAKKILQNRKFKNWKFVVTGNEPREKIDFDHKHFLKTGWISNDKVLRYFDKASIVVVPSRWDEPLGRVAIEASNKGCAVITSDRGGLIETTQHSIVVKNLSEKNFYNKVSYLISNQRELKEIQLKNFYQQNIRRNIKFSKSKINQIRNSLINKKVNINISKPIKILHVADLHLRHEGRLFYSTVKKLNNGFLRSNYSLQNLSDRDTQSFNKNLYDPKGKNYLNNSLENFISNFRPDLILFGHADNITIEKLHNIKKIYPGILMSQWFLDPLINSGPDFKKNKLRISNKINICDSTFVTTDPNSVSFLRNNDKIFYLPNPVDSSIDILENYKLKDPTYDIFLAISHGQHRGTLKKGKIDDRLNLVNKVKKSSLIKVNLFGDENQPIWGDEFFYNLSLCSMAINLSRGKPIKYYSSDRIASLMGNGLLTFIHKDYKFSDFFKNNSDFVEYTSERDLIDKIIFYKKNFNNRIKIAKNGKKKYFKLFNSDDVTRYIVNRTIGKQFKAKWE